MDLKECRAKIDAIDDELADLFKERMDIALSVAQYKQENNINVLNKSREREIIERVTKRVGDELGVSAKVLYNTLFDLSKARQINFLDKDKAIAKEIKKAIENTDKLFPNKAVVACQGVEGAYSQQACDKLFTLPSIMYMNNFESVFSAVEKGLCRFGILPIENSSNGSVNEVYDLMKKYSFYITKSIKLKINHVLLAKEGTKLSDIKEVYTHSQALGQCSKFVHENKIIKFIPCENTATAAKYVFESGRSDVAAISSAECASLYGLSILSREIQNTDNNYTRFICIAKDMLIYPGADKISLMVSLPHTPGSLYQTIARFAALGLNLTKLESRPVVGSDFEFKFYFDFEASVYSDETLSLLDNLNAMCEQFSFLGAYSEV